jgi:hypothetical protein
MEEIVGHISDGIAIHAIIGARIHLEATAGVVYAG